MDPKLLTEAGWKTLVAKFKIKDNGLQKSLAAYENLDENKHPERLKGIASIAQLAAALKKIKEVAAIAPALKYLNDLAAAAEGERKQIEAAVKAALAAKKKEEEDKEKKGGDKDKSKEEEEDDKEEGDYASRLTIAIQKLKGSKGLSYEFIACEAKPVWGVTLAKKIGPKHKTELTKVTGGKRFFPGTCHFDKGHVVFLMDAKVSGLARKLQDSLKNFTGKKFPITVGTESAEEDDDGKGEAGAAHPAAGGASAGAGAAGGAAAATKEKLNKAAQTWHGTRGTVDGKIQELKKAIKAHYADSHPDLLKEIDKNMVKLDGVLDKLDHRLADSLAKAGAAANDAARQAELKNSKAILAEYISYVKSESLIAHMDSNPFGVKTNLKQTLVESVTQMAKAIS